MSLIRLVYGIADKETTTISDTSQRYELYGSPQAMWNVWFQFTQLATLAAEGHYQSAHPRFLKMYTIDGREIDPRKGLMEVHAACCSTYE